MNAADLILKSVNAMRGFTSFYKTKLPLGATPGNAPVIP